MKVVVKRSKWFRGQGTHGSLLLNSKGQMCCLGFAALQLGFKEEEIKGQAVPAFLKREMIGFNLPYNSGLLPFAEHTPLTRAAVHINDYSFISDEEREQQLTDLFKEHGHEIVFED